MTPSALLKTLLTLACLAAASTASAGTLTTWSGTTFNNNWSTNGNWTTKPTTSGTFSLVYRGNPSRKTSTNDIGPGAVAVDSIQFINTNSSTFTGQFILSRSATTPALSLVNGATVTTIAATTGTLSDTISSGLAFGGTAGFNIGSNHNLTLSGTLSGGGTLVKSGSGELLLSGTNNLVALTINQGVVQVNATAFNALSGSGLTVDIGSSDETSTFRTSGVGSAGSAESTNMQFRLYGNTNITPNSSSNIAFDAANFNAENADVTTPVTLTLNGGGASTGGTQTINGAIQDNSASGKVNVQIGTTNSTNAWVFNGQNTYTGDTTVAEGGKLLMNGTISGSSTTTSYGYLGGSGTFNGAVIVSSGTLAPGGSSVGGAVIDTVGALTMASLSLSGSATTQLAITGSTGDLYDQLIGSSTLTYGGTLALTLSGSYVDQTTFNLFSGFTSHSGSFGAITLSAVDTGFDGMTFTAPDANGDWYTGWTANNQALKFSQSTGTLTVVPEPSTWAMALAGLAYGGWQISRRRRLRHERA